MNENKVTKAGQVLNAVNAGLGIATGLGTLFMLGWQISCTIKAAKAEKRQALEQQAANEKN